jgi:hypothetical protein
MLKISRPKDNKRKGLLKLGLRLIDELMRRYHTIGNFFCFKQ